MEKLTSHICCYHSLNGSIIHTLRFLVAHIVSCNNPDHVPWHWLQTTNQIHITSDTVLIGSDPCPKVAHFSVFNIVVKAIHSSTIGERRIPINFNWGITHWICHPHISNCWWWGYRIGICSISNKLLYTQTPYSHEEKVLVTILQQFVGSSIQMLDKQMIACIEKFDTADSAQPRKC